MFFTSLSLKLTKEKTIKRSNYNHNFPVEDETHTFASYTFQNPLKCKCYKSFIKFGAKKIQNRLTGDKAAIKSCKLEAGRQETMYTADPRNLNPNPESRKSTCLALYPPKAQESVVAGTSGNKSENEI